MLGLFRRRKAEMELMLQSIRHTHEIVYNGERLAVYGQYLTEDQRAELQVLEQLGDNREMR